MNKSAFDIYEKVLLYNNFIIDKGKIKGNIKYLIRNKIKKNKTFYKICATIGKINENGSYIIIIEKDYKNYDLYKYDMCFVNVGLLKEIQSEIWDEIYNS